MSEEQKQVATETVSETPTTEAPQVSPNDELIAESKKYRKRAQEAEARLAKYEKAKSQAEEDRLKEKEEFKTLYEQASSKIENLTANADKWSKYEEAKRTALLESHPEEERESLSKLDLETLEFVTNKISNVKPNAPELLGKARHNLPSKPYAQLTEDERRANWNDIVRNFNKKN